MTRRALRRCVRMIVIAACPAFATGCGTPPQEGFVGVGCYDHRNRIVPTVHTPGECAASTWIWRTEPWQAAAPKP